MNRIKFLLVFYVAWQLVACSTIQVNSDYDEAVDFSTLHRYNWLPGQPKKSGNPILDSDGLMHERFKKELDDWFQSHGYEQVSQEQSDFLVGYYLVTEKKTRITVLNDYYGYPGTWRYYGGYWNYPGGTRTYVYDYEEGTLIIDIVNTKTHQLMWRGTAVEQIKNLKTPEQRKAKIAEVINKVMAQFPPG